MRIIEELLQRLAAFLLTAVWFALPLGFGIYQHNVKTELVIDDSRMAAADERAVVWISEEPAAASPDPGGDVGEAQDGTEAERLQDTSVADASNTAPARPTTPAEATPEAAPADVMPEPPTLAAAVRTPRLTPGAVRVPTGRNMTMVRPGTEIGDTQDGAKERPSGTRDCEDPSPAVSKLGDLEYNVDRGILAVYADDYEKLSKLGWVRVHENERGKRDGFTIRGIRCGTLLAQVGLKNRDTIHAVNGKPVKNLFGALSAYRKFKRDDRVELEITRRDELVFITYNMHGER